MTILSRDFDDFFNFAWETHKGWQVESVKTARGVASSGAESFREQ
jgi:hypothetical protein